MSRLTSYLLLLCVLAAWVPSARAQDQALLLGLRYQETISKVPPYYAGRADSLARPAYHTVMIVKRGERISIAGNADGLLVPRGNGFWRIGSKRSVYNDWVEDFIWSAPTGRTPEYPGIQVFNGEYCKGNRVQKILFVGERHLTIGQHSSGYCEGAAHPWSFDNLAFVPIDSTTHMGLYIADVLGPDAEQVLNNAAERYLGEIENPERRARLSEVPDPANWGIVRREGRWVLIGRLDASSEASQGVYADFLLPLAPPASLVGRSVLFPNWREIRAFAPDAIDAFTSPNRDLLVIVHRARLTAHPIVDGQIGPAALTLQLRPEARPVLARWTTGPRVQQWATRLAQARPRAGRTP